MVFFSVEFEAHISPPSMENDSNDHRLVGQHRTTFRIVPNHEVRDVGPLHVRQRQWTRGELHQHGRGQAGLRDHGQCVPWRSQVMTWGSSDTGMLFLMWVKQCHKLSPRKITIFIGYGYHSQMGSLWHCFTHITSGCFVLLDDPSFTTGFASESMMPTAMAPAMRIPWRLWRPRAVPRWVVDFLHFVFRIAKKVVIVIRMIRISHNNSRRLLHHHHHHHHDYDYDYDYYYYYYLLLLPPTTTSYYYLLLLPPTTTSYYYYYYY